MICYFCCKGYNQVPCDSSPSSREFLSQNGGPFGGLRPQGEKDLYGDPDREQKNDIRKRVVT